MAENQPYLSIVSVSRNDNHGEHLLDRMQYFIDSISEQCSRYQLETELIIVEWNPPEDTKGFYEVLQWPDGGGYVKTRIIVVPNKLHTKYENSDRIPLFQMIGKNVGIRRAQGKFILATNIDILFSDELIEYISNKKLKQDVIYRTDRMDASSPFSGWMKFFGKQPIAVIREFCKVNTIRINKKYGTFSTDSRKWDLKARLEFIFNKLKYHSTGKIPFYGVIHANGCGDFTLMSRELWMNLCGYPELEMFSWNIDSLLLIIAYHGGIKEVDLKPPKNVFHIEHGSGSGWTPGKGEELLFKRIEENKIPIFSWDDCIAISRMLNKAGKKHLNLHINEPDWGLERYELEEKMIY